MRVCMNEVHNPYRSSIWQFHVTPGIEQPVSAILQEEEPRRKPPRSQDQTIKKNGPTLQKSQGLQIKISLVPGL